MDGKQRRRIGTQNEPFLCHYTEKEQTIRVFLTIADNVENLRSLTEAIQLTIGGTSVYVNLMPTRPRSELAEVEGAILSKAIRKAKASALVEGLGGIAKGIHDAVPTYERYGAKPEKGTTFVGH
jgi:hypothetical protein